MQKQQTFRKLIIDTYNSVRLSGVGGGGCQEFHCLARFSQETRYTM